MSRNLQVLLRTGLVLSWVVTAGQVEAANPVESAELQAKKAQEYARRALQSDIEGDNVYRDSMLSAALREDPNCQLARWRSGFVRVEDEWISVDDQSALSSRGDGIQKEYESRRNISLDRSREEMNLANWCRRKQLSDVADMHYRRVADNSENAMVLRNAAARKLGLRMILGRWASQEDINEYRLMIRRAERNLQKWSGRISKWARAFKRPRSARASRALDSLRKVCDVSAIPALELMLSSASERLASESVLVIAGINADEATQSLVRHSIASKWPRVRDEATVQLQKRPSHESLPVLLTALQTPIRSVFQVTAGPNGQVLHEHLLAKEKADGFYELTIRELATPVRQLRNVVSSIESAQRQALSARRRAEVIQRQIADVNSTASLVNERVYEVLHRVTGQQMGNDPVAWWDWWKDYNEVERPIVKPTYEFISAETSAYRPIPPRPAYECFPAGTQVWTEHGTASIETIKVGDRVLAQDVKTAELQYKVVSAVTRRWNAPMQKLIIDGKPFFLTTGHPLWINGIGWRMAKRVRLGDRAHSLWGSRQITCMEMSPPGEAFNLVVSDFGTYFVGEAGVLVHDNTYRSPARVTTPGLLAQN